MKRAARRPISFASCRYRGLLARKVSRLSGTTQSADAPLRRGHGGTPSAGDLRAGNLLVRPA